MSRKPVYNNDKSKRVISFPNNQWAPQVFTGRADEKSKTIDFWRNIVPPGTDKARALAFIKDVEKAAS